MAETMTTELVGIHDPEQLVKDLHELYRQAVVFAPEHQGHSPGPWHSFSECGEIKDHRGNMVAVSSQTRNDKVLTHAPDYVRLIARFVEIYENATMPERST